MSTPPPIPRYPGNEGSGNEGSGNEGSGTEGSGNPRAVSPGSGSPATGMTLPPRQVTTAFWLFVAAAVLSLISLAVSLSSIGGTKEAVRKQLAAQGQTITDGQLDGILTASIVVAVVVGLIFVAAYVMFAVFMRRGANWARIVLLVLTVLSLTQIAAGFGLGAVQVVLSVIGAILLLLAPSNQYFREVKARRLASR